LIDIQQKNPRQQQHTTQSLPIKEAIKRSSATNHNLQKNKNQLLPSITINQQIFVMF
jgi:hypothetical protein